MSDLYKNEIENVYQADIGNIVRIKDPKSKYNNKLMYEKGDTFNGYCYKDYNNYRNKPDEVCYITEGFFYDRDDFVFVDDMNKNKDKYLERGGISTANSIKKRVRYELEYCQYYYKYKENGIVQTIEAEDFDEELIEEIADIAFRGVDWHTTGGYISEQDWKYTISDYYDKKLFGKENLEL